MRGVAPKLDPPPKGAVEVRGEVIVRVAAFRSLDETAGTSARNYAAGALRQKDPDAVKGRGLEFVAHDCAGAGVSGLAYTRGRVEVL